MEMIKTYTPELRFPEFHDEWQVKRLGLIAKLYKGKGISKSEALTQGKTPCVRYGELYTYYGEAIKETKSYTNVPYNDLFLGKQNDIVMPSSGETKEDIATASCLMKDNIALGGDINVIRLENNDGLFFAYYLRNGKKNDISKIAQGMSIIHLYNEQLSNLFVSFPTLAEQRKIAECLSSLNELINAVRKKIDLLKQYKKGLIQKLFPKRDSNMPELRFPEFNDDWQVKPLSFFLHEHKLKSEGNEQVYSVSVAKGIVNQIEHLGRSFAASDTSKYKLVKPYDIVYTKSPTGDFPFGIIKQSLNNTNVIVSPLYGVFSPNNKYIGYIIDCYFESPTKTNAYLESIVQKGAKNTIQITNDTFLSKNVLFPTNEDEQRKIASCLSSLNEQIQLYEKKQQQLQDHKKGLMQKMFVKNR